MQRQRCALSLRAAPGSIPHDAPATTSQNAARCGAAPCGWAGTGSNAWRAALSQAFNPNRLVRYSIVGSSDGTAVAGVKDHDASHIQIQYGEPDSPGVPWWPIRCQAVVQRSEPPRYAR